MTFHTTPRQTETFARLRTARGGMTVEIKRNDVFTHGTVFDRKHVHE